MKIYQYLFSAKSMKGKILRIKVGIYSLVEPICKEKFWIHWYGAYNLDPKNVVFWICVKTDREKEKLELDLDLMEKIRFLLVKYNYPEEARKYVYIGFESQETVNRESNGDWYLHFK
ncbi:hypothetical protein GCM10009118_15900 [Wandonia haliotis]|uniref:Uncharacterized protein n=1 Tax=Wandonia haliotis TaxID=574963 RepID=A0ABP3Y492_9FLAO